MIRNEPNKTELTSLAKVDHNRHQFEILVKLSRVLAIFGKSRSDVQAKLITDIQLEIGTKTSKKKRKEKGEGPT